MRETERKDFQNMFQDGVAFCDLEPRRIERCSVQDLTESIDAIGRAQKELKSGQAKVRCRKLFLPSTCFYFT